MTTGALAGLTETGLLDWGRRRSWWRNGLRFRYYCRSQLFEGVPLQGKSLLDVGCGNGRFSLWAVSQGATRVLGLEPSEEGSRSHRPVEEFRTAIREFGLGQVDVQEVTVQEFEPGPSKFDVVLSHASINHIDESGCTTLLEDPAAWARFRKVGEKLRSMMVDGGTIVIVDTSSKNWYGDRGLTNPHAPTIEWEKHQEPETWARVFAEAGFGSERITWLDPAAWPVLGRLTRNRRYAHRWSSSIFRLVMRAE
jgi:cyclopropane fatty-acyl-phospholipid synthase-like methyltransferase